MTWELLKEILRRLDDGRPTPRVIIYADGTWTVESAGDILYEGDHETELAEVFELLREKNS